LPQCLPLCLAIWPIYMVWVMHWA